MLAIRVGFGLRQGDVRYCEGLWMPAGCDGGAGTSAGVRKPPGNEPAGRRATVGACGERYGDLGGAEGLPGWV